MLSIHNTYIESRVSTFLTKKQYNSQIIKTKTTKKKDAEPENTSDQEETVSCTPTSKKRKTTKPAAKSLEANMNSLDKATVFVSGEGYQHFLSDFALDVVQALGAPKTTPQGHCSHPRFYFNEIATSLDTVVRVWFELDCYLQSYDQFQLINDQFDQPTGFVGKVSRVLIEVMRACFTNGDAMHISVIAEQSQGADVGHSIVSNDVVVYKFGLHLKVPEIFVKTRHLLLLRCKLIDALNSQVPLDQHKVVAKDPPPNGKRGVLDTAVWTKVIDDQPIGKGRGLRLPGSFKVDPCSGCKAIETKAKCSMCKGKRIVHIDRCYWPRAWFYAAPLTHPINHTEFFELTKTSTDIHPIGRFVHHSIDTSVMSFSQLLPLLSIKTNGHVIQQEEIGHEQAKFPRNNETIGFTPPTIHNGVASYSSAGSGASGSTTHNSNNTTDATFYLSSVVEYRGVDAQFANAPIRAAMQRTMIFSAISYSDQHSQNQSVVSVSYVKKRGQLSQKTPMSSTQAPQTLYMPQTQPFMPSKPQRILSSIDTLPVSSWEGLLANNTLVQRILQEHKNQQNTQEQHPPALASGEKKRTHDTLSWSNLSIRVMNAGMVHNNITKQSFYALFPESNQTSMFLASIENMHYLLHVFLDPEKNDSSRFCPLKSAMHSANNIYFQMVLPFVTDLHIADKNMLEEARRTLDLVNAMLHPQRMLALTGLLGWPITVRCWHKGCHGKYAHYVMPWEHVLKIVEPMVQRLFKAMNVQKNKNSNIYIAMT